MDEPNHTLIRDKALLAKTYDRLGFSAHVDTLVQEMVEGDQAGYVVGIFGGWGTGKSTLMNFMREQLEEGGVPSVTFVAWQYDRRDDLLAALVTETLTNSNAAATLKEKALALVPTVATLALRVGASVAGRFAGNLFDGGIIDQIKNEFAEGKTKTTLISQFKSQFREAVGVLAGDGKLVIFLDDLDRCLPENVVEILESLKLFLDDAPCVFVLGVDRVVVESAIANHYAGPLAGREQEYLEKIVLRQFDIPTVSEQTMEKAFEVELTEREIEGPERAVVLAAVDGNPRRLKRVLNSLGERLVPDDDDSGIANSPHINLARTLVTCLAVCFPGFYRACARNPEGARRALELFCANASLSEQQIAEEGLGSFYMHKDDGPLRDFLQRAKDNTKAIWGDNTGRTLLESAMRLDDL